MVSREDGKLVLWPVYFDRHEPRPWRRVPKKIAIENPTAEQIAKIAAQLRLKPVLEKGVQHPKRAWRHDGRVLVDIRGSKSVLVRQIAEMMAAEKKA